MSGKERGNSLTRQGTTNLAGASGRELVDDRGVLLAKATGVKKDGTIVALHPAHATQSGFREGQDGQGREGNERFAEHICRTKRVKQAWKDRKWIAEGMQRELRRETRPRWPRKNVN